MSDASFDDAFVNGAKPDPDTAMQHLQTWFGGSIGLVSIFTMPRQWTLHHPLQRFLDLIERVGLAELIWPASEDEQGGVLPQNVYIGVGTRKPAPYRLNQRGKRVDVKMVPGAWADWDARPNAFSGAGEIDEWVAWMDAIGLAPGIVNRSGSEGAHLYWPVEGGCSPEGGEDLSRRIRLLIQYHSGGYKIDEVENCDRVLRLAGTLRQPKGGETRGPRLVELLRCDQGRWLDISRLMEASEALVQADDERLASVPEEMVHPARLVAAGGAWAEQAEDLLLMDLQGLVRLAEAAEGEDRPKKLFAIAASLGEWVEIGELDSAELKTRLLEACKTNGMVKKYGESECKRQADNGIAVGREAVRDGVQPPDESRADDAYSAAS